MGGVGWCEVGWEYSMRGLTVGLDDKKRLVRKEAVAARSEWSVL